MIASYPDRLQWVPQVTRRVNNAETGLVRSMLVARGLICAAHIDRIAAL
jgi:hypothetical protein